MTTKDVKIPFKTERVEDPGLRKGKTEVRQKGQAGIKRITYTDGKETSSAVIRSPINEIIAVGTYVAPKQTTKPAPKPPSTRSVSKTIQCSTNATIRVSGSGSGLKSTAISGPQSSSGSNYAEVTGPPGTYKATVVGSSPRLSVSWSGTCRSS